MESLNKMKDHFYYFLNHYKSDINIDYWIIIPVAVVGIIWYFLISFTNLSYLIYDMYQYSHDDSYNVIAVAVIGYTVMTTINKIFLTHKPYLKLISKDYNMSVDIFISLCASFYLSVSCSSLHLIKIFTYNSITLRMSATTQLYEKTLEYLIVFGSIGILLMFILIIILRIYDRYPFLFIFTSAIFFVLGMSTAFVFSICEMPILVIIFMYILRTYFVHTYFSLNFIYGIFLILCILLILISTLSIFNYVKDYYVNKIFKRKYLNDSYKYVIYKNNYLNNQYLNTLNKRDLYFNFKDIYTNDINYLRFKDIGFTFFTLFITGMLCCICYMIIEFS